MIVVDTSVLIAFLRGDSSRAVTELEKLDSAGSSFAIPTVCMQEVLQGARNTQEWKKLERYLRSNTIIEPQDGVQCAVEAAKIYFDCRRKGLTVRSSVDCWIAALCLERDATLLHEDRDFEAISRVRKLRVV